MIFDLKLKDFEVRIYERTKFALIKYVTFDSEKAQSAAAKKDQQQQQPNDTITKNVWKLMKYTQGENSKQVAMPFIMPVFVFIERLESGAGTGADAGLDKIEVKIMVALPDEYQPTTASAEPPQPNETDIQFEVVDQFKCYVRQFHGFAGDNEFKSETNKLTTLLSERRKSDPQLKFNENKTICIAYDPPYKLFNRRNEVMILAS